ncbi:MAG: acetate uptake transporter [Candidatus Bathyarchaeota archaeon]|nr:MAG: acetate uptake transporter [Candidatus Bathyarchaeota archaeon]
MDKQSANPAPLGLMGFGLTTVLLNIHNAGFYPLNSMILAMGLAYGGLAQIIAGVMEYRRGNTFGTTAFCSYGLFWWSLVAIIIMPTITVFQVQRSNDIAMAAYFFMWGIFTLLMFFGALRTNRTLQFVLASLAILFFLLAARDLTGSVEIGVITGYEGIICGLSAVYLGIAEIINEAQEKTVLPICPVS